MTNRAVVLGAVGVAVSSVACSMYVVNRVCRNNNSKQLCKSFEQRIGGGGGGGEGGGGGGGGGRAGVAVKRCIRFLLQGKVQGVKMRRYVEAVARHFNICGYCINTADGRAVFGEAHGAAEKVALFEAWLRGELRRVFTDLKPTPPGTAYPLLARVERVLIGDTTTTTSSSSNNNNLEKNAESTTGIPFSNVPQFVMVRNEMAALALEQDRCVGTDWEHAQKSSWDPPPPPLGRPGECTDYYCEKCLLPTAAAQSSRSVTASGSAVYESATAVQEYLSFHFQHAASSSSGGAAAYFPYSDSTLPSEVVSNKLLNFAQRCAVICSEFAEQQHSSSSQSEHHRALDVGCAVGASTLELSKKFASVVGIDFSAAFIAAAEQVRQEKHVNFERRVEGDVFETVSRPLDAATNPERVQFFEGDACNLDAPKLGKFHCILAANLLCRLPRPRDFLRSLDSLLEPGGFVVFVSPYSWLSEYTEKALWLGGYVDTNTKQPVWSADTLCSEMSALGFQLKKQDDVPFIIREHRRKFQLGVSHCTIFTRATSSSDV